MVPYTNTAIAESIALWKSMNGSTIDKDIYFQAVAMPYNQLNAANQGLFGITLDAIKAIGGDETLPIVRIHTSNVNPNHALNLTFNASRRNKLPGDVVNFYYSDGSTGFTLVCSGTVDANGNVNCTIPMLDGYWAAL